MAVRPGDRVEELIPSLAQAFEGRTDAAGWTLAPKGEGPLEGVRTIADCGLFPGAILILSAPDTTAPAPPDSRTFSLRSAADVARRVRARFRPTVRPPLDIEKAGHPTYLRTLDLAIAASRSGAGQVVAVMAVRPGVGTTTIAALLATLVNRLRGGRVAVVDAHPESAALSHWLAPDSALSKDAYRSLFGAAVTPAMIQAALVQVGTGLWVLPASADQAGAREADAEAWRRLITHLRHLHNLVVIDCGAGMQRAACQAALDAADQIVLVSAAGERGPAGLAPTLEAIRDRGRPVVVVANQALRPVRATPSADGVQQVTIAYEKEPGRRMKTRGFSWDEAPGSWQEGVRELAATLVGRGA